ncbi:RNA 3'-terminal phosphate cyclase-domain-containing protein [Zopfochytrium polystomum]|nr:RNA 3'-terminal phosphate cyclase-domain-containing protein [Zopfochytrium polystomum]
MQQQQQQGRRRPPRQSAAASQDGYADGGSTTSSARGGSRESLPTATAPSVTTTASAAGADVVTVVDGSVLEGGGQILRNTAAYSVLLATPVLITRIRAARSKPGLRRQHLTGLELVAAVAGAAHLAGSAVPDPDGGPAALRRPPAVEDQAVFLRPARRDRGDGGGGGGGGGRPPERTFVGDTGTAGSVGLLVQVAMPVALFADYVAAERVVLELKGGTNADLSPSIDFLSSILLPFLDAHVLPASPSPRPVTIDVRRRGYMPRGGGLVALSVSPLAADQSLRSFTVLDRGEAVVLRGRIFVAGTFEWKDAERIKFEAVKGLTRVFGDDVVRGGDEIELVKDAPGESTGTAMGCLLWVETTTGCRIAGSGLGGAKTPAHKVAAGAATMLRENWEHGGCVDEFLQDQIVIFMALAEGTSTVVTGPLSLHTRTAIHVAELMTKAKFTVEPLGDGTARQRVSCVGIGLKGGGGGVRR